MRSGAALFSAVVGAALCVSGVPAAAPQVAVKVGFYNVRSGKGVPGLRGRAVPFADVNNCRDRSQPVNAWGAGVVQETLARAVGDDEETIALGLAEAWTAVCASPENVRAALRWSAASQSHNGVALVARHGLRRTEWLQLDTSANTNPADTAWVLFAEVFVDASKRQTLPVYAAHWYGTGVRSLETYVGQAQQTLAFMRKHSAAAPHVLVGDLNVWVAPSRTCRQTPTGSAPLDVLRDAGYADAWTTVHGNDDGATGMLNRPGCGTPEGAAWKRIDYAWSPASYQAMDITLFGRVPAGEAAPSDHLGLLARYPRP